MSKIKFNKSPTIYSGDFIQIGKNQIRITFENEIPTEDVLLSGLYLVNEHNVELIQTVRLDYTYLYRSYDVPYIVELCNDGNIYTPPKEEPPIEEISPEKTEEELQAEFEQVKNMKIQELSNICENEIYTGIEINGLSYSYTMQDQSNLINAITMAQATGLSIPYHADNQPCSLYTLVELMEIYVAEQMNITKNQTYFNQIKLYIISLTDRNDLELVQSIYYGAKLTGEYLDNYNAIMEQSHKIATNFNITA